MSDSINRNIPSETTEKTGLFVLHSRRNYGRPVEAFPQKLRVSVQPNSESEPNRLDQGQEAGRSAQDGLAGLLHQLSPIEALLAQGHPFKHAQMVEKAEQSEWLEHPDLKSGPCITAGRSSREVSAALISTSSRCRSVLTSGFERRPDPRLRSRGDPLHCCSQAF